MIPAPHRDDCKIIAFYLGRIIVGLGCTMAVPAILGLCMGEVAPAFDFLVALEISLIAGLFLQAAFRTSKKPTWMHGMIVVSLAWLAAMFLGAVPLYASGHWKSYLDACFDSMSGFTASGMILVQDLDHLPYSHNLWRHLIMFIGGQGIVIIALSLFVRGFSGGFTMYVGEARDEKILPNIAHTSRFIWLVSMVYLVLGTAALGAAGVFGGMKPLNALFHGACIFMAAFDTGGFTPRSQSIMYYHSLPFELITMVLMIVGSLNFKLHFILWMGSRREIVRDIETRTLFISIMATFLVVAAGLYRAGIYPQVEALFRRGFYILLAGHTTTGFQTVYTRQFIGAWGDLAIAGIMCTMAVGGAVCSTTGGIKIIRIGIIFKALAQDIKKIMLPERAIVVQKFHHVRELFLENKQVRPAMIITLAYLAFYGLGAIVGMAYGHPFMHALFESISATANIGLSSGITRESMAAGLKLTYIIQMWAGRLEFMSVFALAGFAYAAIKGK